jgi:glycosidase
MKKILMAFLCLSANFAFAQAPLLDWTPGFLNEVQAGNVVVTMNGAKGNNGFLNYATLGDVWVHTGVITTLSTGPTDWKYVTTTWGVNNIANNAASLGNNLWSFTFNGNLRTHFNITNPAEKIVKICILFRNGLGTTVQRNSDASDMYIPVDSAGGLQIRFVQPPTEPRYNPWPEPINAIVGQTFPVEVVTNTTSAIALALNGTPFAANPSGTSLLSNPTILQSCANNITAVATNMIDTVDEAINFFISGGAGPVVALPAGVQDGINYMPGDTSVTFVLYAPNKNIVILNGSFNNWSASCSASMNKTPDGLRWWKTINGLTAGVDYKFQYLVDGTIVTTDPYCELILDPSNDNYITAATYPNMPTYPAGQTGIVGVFKTGQVPYNWTATNYTRPDKRNLIVYELLLRDFSPKHSWQSLIDSLQYLKRLGINCIELMPVNEFEGNESWGYNPDFFFAPDKYYGPKNDMKKFIDEAHKIGISVVLDAVLNQVTGLSPLAKMYWNSATNKPTADNPWLNENATHPFNVFNDFNHESEITKYHVARFMRHWMKEYNVDGFRWDLAKGFTQVNSGSNVGQWGNYDPSRVIIWKRYYDSMQAIAPGSYCILEFLGGDQEEAELTNYGMMPWGKQTDEYNENTMGQSGNKSIDRAYAFKRTGYNQLGLVTYAESHDEERIMYKNLLYGNSVAGYNVKNLNTALKRQEAMHACLLMIPGPKMIWQFGELGYDYSIFTCEDSVTINVPDCKLSKKPIRWDFTTVPARKNIYDAVAKMNTLRAWYPNLFINNTLVTANSDLGSNFIKKIALKHTDLSIVTVANFDVVSQTFATSFPSNGKWYNYMGTDSISVAGGSKSLTLAPGDYKIYTTKNLNDTTSGPNAISDVKNNGIFIADIYPNPANDFATISISAKYVTNATINLLDVTGKLIKQIINNPLQIGENNMDLPLSNICNGFYLVTITINGVTEALPLQINK